MFWSKQLFGEFLDWVGSCHLSLFVLLSQNSHNVWRTIWNGFGLDECFARLLEVVYRRMLVIVAVMILDKWLSVWMGSPLAKAVGAWLSRHVFGERFSVIRVITVLLAAVLVAALVVGQLGVFV